MKYFQSSRKVAVLNAQTSSLWVSESSVTIFNKYYLQIYSFPPKKKWRLCVLCVSKEWESVRCSYDGEYDRDMLGICLDFSVLSDSLLILLSRFGVFLQMFIRLQLLTIDVEYHTIWIALLVHDHVRLHKETPPNHHIW